MQYIPRAISKVLRNRLENSKVVMLKGARQVGKSTLLSHELDGFSTVTFDNREERRMAKEEPGLFFLNNKPPLVIDEVQKQTDVLEEIKLRVDESDEKGQYVLTGSSSIELAKGASESLAGRVSVLDLGCLSMREIFGVKFNEGFIPSQDYFEKREQHLIDYSDVFDVIFQGCYPEMHSSNRDWEDFYSSYVNTYIERDINEQITTDSVTFSKFMTVVAARTGEMLNYANISREVEVSLPTVKSWISILERCGIVHLLQPFSSSAIKRAVKTPKIYFSDTGLACYLAGWTQKSALERSAVAGNMFETFVVSEIVKSFSNAGMRNKNRLFYYRGKDKSSAKENEIDLVIDINGQLFPIEIKMTCNPTSKMASANTVLNKVGDKEVQTGVILCLCDKLKFLSENVLAVPLRYL